MSKTYLNFQPIIEKEFMIVNKQGEIVPFLLNKVQRDFLEKATGRDVILKARQMGFSSLILAILTCDFLFKDNQRCVVVSHETEATQRLLDRVKFYISSFETTNKFKLPLKYNSRSELANESNNSTFYIGTAEARAFGRGDTITALHFSEFAHFMNAETVLAGVLQAVVPEGKIFIETTANGFNFFKTFWDEAYRGERPFKTHFYGPEWEYTTEFLKKKQKELGRMYGQEYPDTPEMAFLTSGEMFFNSLILQDFLKDIKEPIKEGVIY
jgi:hypothetical protein